MKLEKYLDGYGLDVAFTKDEMEGLHVIGACAGCTQFVSPDKPELFLGDCDSELHSTPETCYQDFGCIHWEPKQ